VEMLEGKLASVRESGRLELKLLQDKETFHGQRVKSYMEALAALEVKAPAAGVVIYHTDWNNQKRQVGSTVFMMDKVMSIPDLDSLQVRGQVAEVDAHKVRLGQAVNVTFDAIPERVFRGRITQVADMFSRPPGDRALKVLEITVRLDVLDPQRMRPGMAARLAVEMDAFRGVLAVPLAVIREEGGRSWVTVKENGRAVRREVTVGRNNGIVAIIDKGLKAGDQVAGKPQMQNGESVNR
jgi:HlyD family secretion protein